MRAPAGAAAAIALLALSAAAAPARPAAPRPVALRWLEMVDEQHGYALSGQDRFRLLRTDDGGRRFADITPGGGAIHPSGPPAVDHGSTLLFSTLLSSTTRGRVFAVERSDDGGRHWRRSLPFGEPRGLDAGTPGVVDARHLYVAVDEGAAAGSQGQALFVSGDGGHRWRLVSRTSTTSTRPGALPFGCDKDGFGFATASRGWAGGYCAGGRPFFYRTDDGGRSWRLQPLAGLVQCACGTTAPRFVTPRDGVFSVGGFTGNGSGRPFVRFYWTSDAGDHWRATTAPVGRPSQALAVANAHTAWVVATRAGRIATPFDTLARTSDAGRHWQTRRLRFDAEPYALDALDAQAAYAFGVVADRTSILRTRDGGRTWQTIPTSLAPRSGAATTRTPRWLAAAEALTLDRVFGGARPIHTFTIAYPRKIAVIFEFDRVVRCGACSAPSNAGLPGGRVIRVGYDRRTHAQGDAMQFCESTRKGPPRARCLRR